MWIRLISYYAWKNNYWDYCSSFGACQGLIGQNIIVVSLTRKMFAEQANMMFNNHSGRSVSHAKLIHGWLPHQSNLFTTSLLGVWSTWQIPVIRQLLQYKNIIPKTYYTKTFQNFPVTFFWVGESLCIIAYSSTVVLYLNLIWAFWVDILHCNITL